MLKAQLICGIMAYISYFNPPTSIHTVMTYHSMYHFLNLSHELEKKASKNN